MAARGKNLEILEGLPELFTVQDLMKAKGCIRNTAQPIIHRWEMNGLIQRIGENLYTRKTVGVIRPLVQATKPIEKAKPAQTIEGFDPKLLKELLQDPAVVRRYEELKMLESIDTLADTAKKFIGEQLAVIKDEEAKERYIRSLFTYLKQAKV